MNRLLSNLPFVEASADVTEDDVKKVNPFPRGPQRVKYLTTGQMRRRAQRVRTADAQKANKAYRKNWFKDQRRVSVLRGWLTIIDNPQAFSPVTVNFVRQAMFRDYVANRLRKGEDVGAEFGPVLEQNFADAVFAMKEAFAEDLSRAADRLLVTA